MYWRAGFTRHPSRTCTCHPESLRPPLFKPSLGNNARALSASHQQFHRKPRIRTDANQLRNLSAWQPAVLTPTSPPVDPAHSPIVPLWGITKSSPAHIAEQAFRYLPPPSQVPLSRFATRAFPLSRTASLRTLKACSGATGNRETRAIGPVSFSSTGAGAGIGGRRRRMRNDPILAAGPGARKQV